MVFVYLWLCVNCSAEVSTAKRNNLRLCTQGTAPSEQLCSRLGLPSGDRIDRTEQPLQLMMLMLTQCAYNDRTEHPPRLMMLMLTQQRFALHVCLPSSVPADSQHALYACSLCGVCAPPRKHWLATKAKCGTTSRSIERASPMKLFGSSRPSPQL